MGWIEIWILEDEFNGLIMTLRLDDPQATDKWRIGGRPKAEQSGRPVQAVVDELRASNPQNRLIQPQEVADLIAYFGEDAAAAMTMEDIQITAGGVW